MFPARQLYATIRTFHQEMRPALGHIEGTPGPIASQAGLVPRGRSRLGSSIRRLAVG